MSRKAKKGAARESSTKTLPDLPEEIVFFQILNRVPVKSLMRFRCVSKHWCRTIGDPEFISSHVNHAKENPSIMALFHLREKGKRFGDTFNFISFGPNFDGCSKYLLLEPIRKERTFLIGFCNGLFCVGSANGCEVWNLSTNEVLSLAFPKFVRVRSNGTPLRTADVVAYGFGYDALNNEYKVIQIVHGNRLRLMVYTLGTNSWRDITDTLPNRQFLKYFGPMSQAALYPSGGKHLVWFDENQIALTLFDIHSEKFSFYHFNRTPSTECCAPCFTLARPLFFDCRGCPTVAFSYYPDEEPTKKFEDGHRHDNVVMFLHKFSTQQCCVAEMTMAVPFRFQQKECRIRLGSFLGKDIFYWYNKGHITFYNPLSHNQASIFTPITMDKWFQKFDIFHHVENLHSLKTFLPSGKGKLRVRYINDAKSRLLKCNNK